MAIQEKVRVPEPVSRELIDEVETAARKVEAPVKGGPVWGLLRIALGWIFLWSFVDKLLSLGFATGRDPETGAIDFLGDGAWINGGSPTEGFLQFGTRGPLGSEYAALASQSAWIDWVYMLSLAAIGLALILGVGVRLAAIGGIAWMALFYTSSAIWPTHNPFLDDHVIYAIALVGIAWVGAGRYLGLGRWWERTEIVQRYPILK